MSREIKVQTQNNIYQKLVVLKTNRNKRFKYKEFIVEGVRNIKEAIQNKWCIHSFIYSQEMGMSDWAKGVIRTEETIENYNLSEALLKELSGKEDTSEIMAVIVMREDDMSIKELSDNPVLALFDRPSNKGNLGTIIRSCDSLGVEMLILTGHAVDLYDPDVITATMGSFFNMKVVRVAENATVLDFLSKLKERFPDFKSIGTTAHKKNPLYTIDMTGPVMFMIGNETDGLCNAFQEACDILGTIPMAETSFASSFNVGCAATVMFYEASRQRAVVN